MLPKNSTPTYSVKLPVSGKTISYRPWVAIENKKYLISTLSKDNNEIQNALVDILTGCTFGEIQIDDLPLADFEFLFTRVKAKSKDEIVYLNYNATEESDGINVIVPIELNLMEVEVTPIPETKIMILDKLGLIMKIPSLKESREIDKTEDDFEKLALMIDTVFDEQQIYDSSNFTFKELVEWIKNLTEKQLNKIVEFIEKLPTIKVNIDFIILETGKKKQISLKGLSDFFL